MVVFIGSKETKKNNPEASDASFWEEYLQEETEFFTKHKGIKDSNKVVKKLKVKLREDK